MVPAATAPGEVVVNGMSLSRRDSPFANSGFVVQIRPQDIASFQDHGPLMGLEAQRQLEQHMFALAHDSQQQLG